MKKYQSIADVAEEILKKEGTPLHYMEMTNRILLAGKCRLNGKTPYETVRSGMGKNPKFIRVGGGNYALKEWSNFKESRYAKDIAYDILLQNGQPMSLEELGMKLVQDHPFVDGAKPIVRQIIRSDKRFYIEESTKKVGLIIWKSLVSRIINNRNRNLK